jgi:hypothetical protein
MSEGHFQSEIAHHGSNQGVMSKSAIPQHLSCRDGKNGVPIYNLPSLIYQNGTVGISIKGNANLGPGFPDEPLDMMGIQSPTITVNVFSVWINTDRCDMRTEFLEHFGSEFVGRTIAAIYNHLHSFKCQVARKGVLDKDVIPTNGIIDAESFTNSRGSGSQVINCLVNDQGFNLILGFVRQLKSIAREDFDTVVLKRIV